MKALILSLLLLTIKPTTHYDITLISKQCQEDVSISYGKYYEEIGYKQAIIWISDKDHKWDTIRYNFDIEYDETFNIKCANNSKTLRLYPVHLIVKKDGCLFLDTIIQSGKINETFLNK